MKKFLLYAALLFSLSAASIIFYGCGQNKDLPVSSSTDPDSNIPKTGAKVFLLGLDGIDWYAIDAFIQQGRLPNLKKMIETGASGILKTDFGDSPVTWTTIATGVKCEKHGICPEAGGGTHFAWTSAAIRYPRLWEVLGEYQMTSRVVSYFFIDDLQGKGHPLLSPGDSTGGQIKMHPIISRAAGRLGMKGEFFINGRRHLAYSELNSDLNVSIQKEEWAYKPRVDLNVTHFQDIDEASHAEYGFFKLLEKQDALPQELLARANAGADFLADVYSYMDEIVGRVKDRYPESLFVICSDHGFIPARFTTGVYIEPELAKDLGFSDGIVTEAKQKVDEFNAEVSITQKEFTASYWNQEVNIDYPLINFSGPEAEKAAKAVMEKLKALKLKESPIFKMTSPTKISFNMDLKEQWYKLPTIVGPLLRIGLFNGTHYQGVHGVVILSGPGVKPGYKITDTDVHDIAPTIYSYLGIPPAMDLDGKALKDAFEKGALPGLSKSRAKTFGVAKGYDPDAGKKALPPEQLNKLKSIGYL